MITVSIIQPDPKLAIRFVEFLGLFIEAKIIDIQSIESFINDIIKEYSSDFENGAEVILACIKLFGEWDKRSPLNEKIKRIREALRKSADQIIENRTKITDCDLLQELAKNEPKLMKDVQTFIKSDIRQAFFT